MQTFYPNVLYITSGELVEYFVQLLNAHDHFFIMTLAGYKTGMSKVNQL